MSTDNSSPDEVSKRLSNITVKLNPPGFSEWQQVLDLLQACFAYMSDRIDPPSSLHRLDVDSLKAKSMQEHIVIARSDDCVIGCAFGAEIEGALYIGKVAVSSEFRGGGVASRMISTLESEARSLGKRALELEIRIELTENHIAFAKLGFVKTGESAHAGYVQSTSITMRKDLA